MKLGGYCSKRDRVGRMIEMIETSNERMDTVYQGYC